MSVYQILLLAAVGLVAGFTSGSMGIGGGIIVVPALVLLMGFSQHQAQGTSIAMMLMPVGIFAAINYYKEGYINIKYALVLALFFLAGSYLGSLMAVNINASLLKKIFAVVLILVGIKMILSK